MNFLLDTNVVSNYIKGVYKGNSEQFTDAVINQTTYISVVTRIELLSWRSVRSEDKAIINEFIRDSTVFSLTETVILKTIEIKRDYRIKMPDAIIAATAIFHDLMLLTHNTKDFINIKGLTVVNPVES